MSLPKYLPWACHKAQSSFSSWPFIPTLNLLPPLTAELFLRPPCLICAANSTEPGILSPCRDALPPGHIHSFSSPIYTFTHQYQPFFLPLLSRKTSRAMSSIIDVNDIIDVSLISYPVLQYLSKALILLSEFFLIGGLLGGTTTLPTPYMIALWSLRIFSPTKTLQSTFSQHCLH